MSIDNKTLISTVRMGGATLSGTTPANTSLVDMQGFEALTVLLTTGTVTDAGTTAGFTMKLQHSDSTAAASFVDCAADEIVGANLTVTDDAADDQAIGTIGYIGNRRYVRAVVTGTTGTNAVFVAFGLLGSNSSRSAPLPAVIAAVAAT